MKTKRRINSIYKKLLKIKPTEETVFAMEILGRVLEGSDLKFEDIIQSSRELLHKKTGKALFESFLCVLKRRDLYE